MVGLIGIKCGTTRWVNSDGTIEQATLIKIDSNHITAVMTQEKHGYSALQLASISVEKNISKPKRAYTTSSVSAHKRKSKSHVFQKRTKVRTRLVMLYRSTILVT